MFQQNTRLRIDKNGVVISDQSWLCSYTYTMLYPHGGFLKWGYPQSSSSFVGFSPTKTIQLWGSPIYGNPHVSEIATSMYHNMFALIKHNVVATSMGHSGCDMDIGGMILHARQSYNNKWDILGIYLGHYLVVHPTNRVGGLVHPRYFCGLIAPTKIPLKSPGL